MMTLQERYTLIRVEMCARHMGQFDNLGLHSLQAVCPQPNAMSLELVKQTGQTCDSLPAGEFSVEMTLCEAVDWEAVEFGKLDGTAFC